MEPDANPYATPRSDLERPEEPYPGTRLPFEDPQTYPAFGTRLKETLRWLYQDLDRAGQGIGGRESLGAPIAFFALLGLLPSMVLGLASIFHPIQPFWSVWTGPKPSVTLSGQVTVFMALGVVLGGPISTAIGMVIMGLLQHLGLWIVRGAQAGLLVTFRSLLYASAAFSVVMLPFQLLVHVPGPIGAYAVLGPLLLQIVFYVYQGVVLARSHRTETWRGVLGVWLPILVLLLLAAACLGSLLLLGGSAFQRGFLEGLKRGL